MYGSFSYSSLRSVQELFDFTRCVRPDGTTYGSRGKCRQGTEIGAKEVPNREPKPRAALLSKHEKIAIKVMADKSLRSDRKRIAEMVRLGVPKDTDFVKLVSDAKGKIGLRAEDTVRGSVKGKKEKPTQPAKSAAERMAGAAEKLEKKTPTKAKSKQKTPDETTEVQTAAAKVAQPVNPKVAAQSQAKPSKGTPKGVSDERLKKSFDQALATVDRLEKEAKRLSKEGAKWDDPRVKAVAEKRALAQGALTTIRQAYHASDRDAFLRTSSEAYRLERISRRVRANAEKEAKEQGLNVYTLPDNHPTKQKFDRAFEIEQRRTKEVNPRIQAAFYGEPASISKAKSDGGGNVSSSVPSGLSRGGANKDLKDFLEGSSVVMAFPVSGFTKFVKDGEAKNGFEAGTGGIKKGKSGYLANRRGGEETVLGLPEGTDPKGRPVYAALEHPDRTRSLQGGSYNQMADYGGIQVIFNPSVKDRSTFTVGDSLDYAAPRKILGSPVRDPANPTTKSSSGTQEVEFDAGGGTSSSKMTIRGGSYDLPSNPPYVEAQIHGGLRVADIQEVRYYRGHEIPAATRRALEKQGVRIVELPPQMNSLVHYGDSPGYRDIESLSMEQ